MDTSKFALRHLFLLPAAVCCALLIASRGGALHAGPSDVSLLLLPSM